MESVIHGGTNAPPGSMVTSHAGAHRVSDCMATARARSGAWARGATLCVLFACSATPETNGFEATGDAGNGGSSDDAGGSTGDNGNGDTGAPPGSFGATDAGRDSAPQPAGDATVTMTTTIYANTDDSLYSMDPKTKAISLIGKFTGIGGGTGDTAVTDCAVNAAGDVYVNTESVVYKATLPSGASGSVPLAKVAAIALQQNQRFYALAFAPAGVLGAGESLVGGDGNGELWSIDTATGATRDLGNFGGDPNHTQSVLALSGDIVFYVDANQKPTGLATIRSCTKSGTKLTCDKTQCVSAPASAPTASPAEIVTAGHRPHSAGPHARQTAARLPRCTSSNGATTEPRRSFTAARRTAGDLLKARRKLGVHDPTTRRSPLPRAM
jgi:hypothetical protein